MSEQPAQATDEDHLVADEEGAPGEPGAREEDQDPEILVDSVVDENGDPL